MVASPSSPTINSPASGLPASRLEEETARRRTFAIISHPDAGKTTLTEKLLLLGGAIHLAGQVKARGDRRRARSDWMAIEQQRGISVTTSVMTFEYDGITCNLLDTPGHEDFSEDTYRTLTAVDSAIMVIDAAKGIEPQTRKLFEVCRMRDLPITTFINKMDREGRDPFELLDEIAETLQLETSPASWPVGQGLDFKGCYDLRSDRMLMIGKGETANDHVTGPSITDPSLRSHIGDRLFDQLAENVELARVACPTFDAEAYRAGNMTPVYFGSALKDFGVKEVLNGIAAHAPAPRAQPAVTRLVEPTEEKVSAFVFKVQANMDKNHRDRVAFVRLCSGQFKRGMKLRQPRTGKTHQIYNPILFFAQSRELAEEAWPGDIIGIPNHGTLRVGDTLCEAEDLSFTGIPDFAPEILQRVRLDDPMKSKQLRSALEDMAEEGVTQVFKPVFGSQWIVGVIGQLQLDVLSTRIAAEYNVNAGFEPAPFYTARWVSGDQKKVREFIEKNKTSVAEDRDGNAVYMARNSWDLNNAQQTWPDLVFSATRERA